MLNMLKLQYVQRDKPIKSMFNLENVINFDCSCWKQNLNKLVYGACRERVKS